MQLAHTEAMKSLNDTTGYSQQEATSTTTTQALPQSSEIQLVKPARLKDCGEQPVAGHV
jgi:hypothetical protein